MKKIIGLTLGITCLAAALSAQATTTAQLIVKGTITPASCSLTLGNGGIIDYGTIRSSQLSATTFTALAERATTLSVNCGSTPAQIGITFSDSQAGSRVPGILSAIGPGYSETQNFGLGAVGTSRTGGYAITLRSAQVNGTTMNPIVRVNEGAWQSSDGRVAQSPSQYSWRNGSANIPAFIGNLNGQLVVRAVINRRDALDLSRSVELAGRTTLVLSYI